jgi:hypothetical protein
MAPGANSVSGSTALAEELIGTTIERVDKAF